MITKNHNKSLLNKIFIVHNIDIYHCTFSRGVKLLEYYCCGSLLYQSLFPICIYIQSVYRKICLTTHTLTSG